MQAFHRGLGGPLDRIRRHWAQSPQEVAPVKSSNFVDVHTTSTAFNRAFVYPEVHIPEDYPGFPETYRNVKPVIIVMPHLREDGKIGIVLDNLKVTQVYEEFTKDCGWMVGDRIVAVNGVAIRDASQFQTVLVQSVRDFFARGTALTFQVHRDLTPKMPRRTRECLCCGDDAPPAPAKRECRKNQFDAENFYVNNPYATNMNKFPNAQRAQGHQSGYVPQQLSEWEC